jgi:hypothetical protein
MAGELLYLPNSKSRGAAEFRERLERMAAIFTAIEAGELLSALPDCPFARDNHRAAVNLLSIVEIELHRLCDELEDLD